VVFSSEEREYRQILKPRFCQPLKLRNILDKLISKTDAPRWGVERLMGSALELIAEADDTKPAPGEATPNRNLSASTRCGSSG